MYSCSPANESGKYSFYDYLQEMGVASNQVGCAGRSYRRNTWHLNEVASPPTFEIKFAQSATLWLSARRHVTVVRRSREVSITEDVRERDPRSRDPSAGRERTETARECLPTLPRGNRERGAIPVHAVRKGSRGRRTELSTGEPRRDGERRKREQERRV